MTDNVLACQHADADLIDIFKHPKSIVKAGSGAVRQILLGHIAGDDGFGSKTDSGQEHFHLGRRCVLRLVQNHKGIIQRPSAHVCKGCHFD